MGEVSLVNKTKACLSGLRFLTEETTELVANICQCVMASDTFTFSCKKHISSEPNFTSFPFKLPWANVESL